MWNQLGLDTAFLQPTQPLEAVRCYKWVLKPIIYSSEDTIHTDLFLSPPTSLSLCFSPSHTDCLSRSLILQFYHAVSISHFLPHTVRLVSFLFSGSHVTRSIPLSYTFPQSCRFFTSPSFAGPFQPFTVAPVLWRAHVTDTHRGWSC